MKTATTAGIAVGVIVIGVTGHTPPPSVPVPLQPDRDVGAWSMPLDSFVGVHPEAAAAAEWVLLRPCLAEQGWSVPLPERDTDLLLSAESWRDDITVVPPLDAERAGVWGHQTPRDPQADEWRQFAMKHNADPALGAAEDVCLPLVRTEAFALSQGGEWEAQSEARLLRHAARERALTDPTVKESADAWRACLAPAAASRILPDNPMSLLQDPYVDPSTLVAPVTAEGVAFGLADVACQRSSGWRDALYDAQWKQESLVSDDDAAMFDRVGGALLQQDRAVRKVLAG